jgi:hypothetical protein
MNASSSAWPGRRVAVCGWCAERGASVAPARRWREAILGEEPVLAQRTAQSAACEREHELAGERDICAAVAQVRRRDIDERPPGAVVWF